MMFNIMIGIIVILGIYLFVRVAWVSSTLEDWNYKVFNYRSNLISDYNWDEHSRYLYSEFIDSVYSFHKMMLCFWSWNIKDMIKDEKLYNMVIEGS